MKKYFVIGNPITHSLSPDLHNFWFNINKIEAIYKKQELINSKIYAMRNKIKNNEFAYLKNIDSN